jgi:putative restriction endonuclease
VEQGSDVNVPYGTQEPFIANTDGAWFEFLSSRAVNGRVDEVNFWQPKATRPMKQMLPGEPIFFRLKSPVSAIAGYGFFAHFACVSVDTAWSSFGFKNGDPNRVSFFQRIGKYRRIDLLDPCVIAEPIGCTILRDATFWPPERWMPWGKSEGWATNIVQGKTERDPVQARRLIGAMQADARKAPADLVDQFRLVDVDAREVAMREVVEREGQGAFRLRLLRAYQSQCAITGEHTEPVLDAAHIQPYLGPASNHVQNGLILAKEFHALFDQGYVGVTPDYEVRVSERLRAEWQNGKRYYPYDNAALRIPDEPAMRPSRDALAWHFESVFRRAG